MNEKVAPPSAEEIAGILSPRIVDLQVNGGGGALFNATPTAEGIRKIAAAHRHFGTTGILPTVITDIKAAIKAGVSCATHLFNAMSPMQSRNPGVIGAVINSEIAAGSTVVRCVGHFASVVGLAATRSRWII